MKRMTLRRAAGPAAVLALGLALTGCAASNETDSASAETGSDLSGELNAGGASSQEAAQTAWRAGFQDANPDVTVNYDGSNSLVNNSSLIGKVYFPRLVLPLASGVVALTGGHGRPVRSAPSRRHSA